MADTFPTPPKTDWWDAAKRGVSTVLDVTPEGRAAKAGYQKVKGGVPVGDIVQQQADKGPDDPSRWVLNTIQDLGLISAKAVQGLTTPANLGLIAAMSVGQEEAALPILAKLGFSGEMAKDAIKGLSQGYKEAKKGNLREAGRLFGSAGVNALLIALATKKAPKGATYRVSEGEVPKQLTGEVPAPPTAKDIPLPTREDAEIVTPKPPERRLDLATRHEVTDLMGFDKTLSREEAIKAVFDAREAAKNAKPLPRYADTIKGIVPPPGEPVPPPPDIIQQPRTIKAAGEPVTVTPDDIRTYVGAKLGTGPFQQVFGPKGDVQDLTNDQDSEPQRIRGHKLTAGQHAELFPGGKYRAGMTVGEAVDAQPGARHPESGRKYSSTQIDLPKPAADKITALAKTIPDSDISGKGREENPHVTVKYGLHDEEPEGLQSFLHDHGPVTLTLGKTNFFPPSKGSEGNDVVVVEVKSPQLHDINSDITNTFPVTDTHPEYKPHITLAYVKPGAGQKYAGNTALEGQQVQAKEITFSSRNGKEHAIKLGGDPTATLQPVPPPPQSAVPPSPDFALTPPGQTGPQIEPGWKTSLGSYDKTLAAKYLKSYRRNSEDAKLVPDPKDPKKFWVTFKPKAAPPAAAPKALGPAGRKPYEAPTGPKPAPWESRGIFVERRVKELNRQAIDLMQAEKDVPEDVWKELEPLQDELEQNRAEERKELPQIQPKTPKSREGVSKGTPEARSPAPAPSAPPSVPKESIPEKKIVSSQFEGLLGPLKSLPVDEIKADPKRMQFRTELSRVMRAAINSSNVKYSPELSEGPITVWRDPENGKLYVVDGHHRLEIAKRSGTKDIETRELNAPDYQTARAFGALRNIASGHATATDVAKFMRDTGVTADDLEKRGIALGSKIVSEGSRLANLDDAIFEQVISGRMPESTGAAIGTVADKTKQAGLAQLIAREKGRNLTQGTVDSLARRAQNAETTEKQTLFGTETESNVLQAARLEDYTRNRLASDKRLFGYVAKGERPAELARAGNVIDIKGSKSIAGAAKQALDVFDKLVERTGAINDAINEGAAAIAAGESESSVRDRVYRMVHDAVQTELGVQK